MEKPAESIFGRVLLRSRSIKRQYSICAPTRAFERERGIREAMDRFHRNFRDNLRTTPGTLVIAAAIVAALVLLLVLAYSFFHLGEPPPAPR
jgi:hypothetical protein